MSDDPNSPYGGAPPGAGGPPSEPQGTGASPQGGQPFGQGPPAGQGQPPSGGLGQQPAGYGQAPGHGQQPGGYGQPGAPMGPQGQPPYGQPPGGGYGGPPAGGGQPTGWRVAAIVLLVIGPVLSIVGMIPCLGILNWLAIPTNVALCIVGILGMTVGPKAPDGRAADFPIHLAAIITGLLLAIASIVRCTMGSGLV